MATVIRGRPVSSGVHQLGRVKHIMGLFSDLSIPDAAPAPNYEAGETFDDADKCQFKGLTPAAMRTIPCRSSGFVKPSSDPGGS